MEEPVAAPEAPPAGGMTPAAKAAGHIGKPSPPPGAKPGAAPPRLAWVALSPALSPSLSYESPAFAARPPGTAGRLNGSAVNPYAAPRPGSSQSPRPMLPPRPGSGFHAHSTGSLPTKRPVSTSLPSAGAAPVLVTPRRPLTPPRPPASLPPSKRPQTSLGIRLDALAMGDLDNLEGRPRRVMSAGTKPPWLYANMRYGLKPPPAVRHTPRSAFTTAGVSERGLTHAASYAAPRPAGRAVSQPRSPGSDRRRAASPGVRPSILGHPLWVGTGDEGDHPNFVPTRFMWLTQPGNQGDMHELAVLTTRGATATRTGAPFLHTGYAREAVHAVLARPTTAGLPTEFGAVAAAAGGGIGSAGTARPGSASARDGSSSRPTSAAAAPVEGGPPVIGGQAKAKAPPTARPGLVAAARRRAESSPGADTAPSRRLSTLHAVEAGTGPPSWQELKPIKRIFGPNPEVNRRPPPPPAPRSRPGTAKADDRAAMGDVADRVIYGGEHHPGAEGAGGHHAPGRRLSNAQRLWAVLRHKFRTDALFLVGLKQARLLSEYAEMARAKKTVKAARETAVRQEDLAMEAEATIKEKLLEAEIRQLEDEQRRLQAERELALVKAEAVRLAAARTEYNSVAGAADARRRRLESLAIEHEATCAITPTARPLINPASHFKAIPLDSGLADLESEVTKQEARRDAELEHSDTLRTMLQRMIVTHKAAHAHTQAMRLLSGQYETDKAALESIAREIEREALESQARVLMRRKEVSSSHAKTEAQLVRRRETHASLIIEIKFDAARQARAKQLEKEALDAWDKEQAAAEDAGPAAAAAAAAAVGPAVDEALEAKMSAVARLAGTADADVIVAKYDKSFWVASELAAKRAAAESRLESLRRSHRESLVERDAALYGLDARLSLSDSEDSARRFESRLRAERLGASEAAAALVERQGRLRAASFGLRAYADTLRCSLGELFPEAALDGPAAAAAEAGGDLAWAEFLVGAMLTPGVKGVRPLGGTTLSSDVISPATGVRKHAADVGRPTLFVAAPSGTAAVTPAMTVPGAGAMTGAGAGATGTATGQATLDGGRPATARSGSGRDSSRDSGRDSVRDSVKDGLPSPARATRAAVLMTVAGPQLVQVPMGTASPTDRGRAHPQLSFLHRAKAKKDSKITAGQGGGLAALIAAAMEEEDEGAVTLTESGAAAKAARATMLASLLGVKQEEEEDESSHKLPRFLYNVRVIGPDADADDPESAPHPPHGARPSKFGRGGQGRSSPTADDDECEVLSMKAAREEAAAGSGTAPGSKRGGRPLEEMLTREAVKLQERKVLSKHKPSRADAAAAAAAGLPPSHGPAGHGGGTHAGSSHHGEAHHVGGSRPGSGAAAGGEGGPSPPSRQRSAASTASRARG